jgi:hypothetical protein
VALWQTEMLGQDPVQRAAFKLLKASYARVLFDATTFLVLGSGLPMRR